MVRPITVFHGLLNSLTNRIHAKMSVTFATHTCSVCRQLLFNYKIIEATSKPINNIHVASSPGYRAHGMLESV